MAGRRGSLIAIVALSDARQAGRNWSQLWYKYIVYTKTHTFKSEIDVCQSKQKCRVESCKLITAAAFWRPPLIGQTPSQYVVQTSVWSCVCLFCFKINWWMLFIVGHNNRTPERYPDNLLPNIPLTSASRDAPFDTPPAFGGGVCVCAQGRAVLLPVADRPVQGDASGAVRPLLAAAGRGRGQHRPRHAGARASDDAGRAGRGAAHQRRHSVRWVTRWLMTGTSDGPMPPHNMLQSDRSVQVAGGHRLQFAVTWWPNPALWCVKLGESALIWAPHLGTDN